MSDKKISLTEAVRIAREKWNPGPPSTPIQFDGDDSPPAADPLRGQPAQTDWKEHAERWDEILPQLEGERFFEYKVRLIEHLEDQLKVAREERSQEFNAGWNAAVREIAEKAPYMRLFRLRESIRANLRPPLETRKVVTQNDIDRIDAEEGPNRAVAKGRSNRFGDSHD